MSDKKCDRCGGTIKDGEAFATMTNDNHVFEETWCARCFGGAVNSIKIRGTVPISEPRSDISVRTRSGIVHVDFRAPVSFLMMNPAEAHELGMALIQHASEAVRNRKDGQ